MLSILQLVVYFVTGTLAIGFPEVNGSAQFYAIAVACLAVQIGEMGFKCLCQSQLKVQNENEYDSLRELARHYLHGELVSDLIILSLLVLDCCSVLKVIPWIRLLILVKVRFWQEMVNTLEITFISNCYKEQYWELVKVFIFNYAFAHIVGLVLVMIADAQPGNNWLKNYGFAGLPWFEKYIWAYYWAINIMFTVGFGDISAVTSTEAAAMIFIETMSCIVLAYNISNVGSIIKEIKSYDEDKERNIKTFARMKEKTNLSSELKKKMRSFISESIDMKRNHNIEEEERLLEGLPESILEEYRKETNIEIFKDLPFIKLISTRYLQELSIFVERKLAHPEEVILGFNKVPNIVIVQGGEISLNAHRNGYKLHGKPMQSVKLEQSEYKLLSFNFLLNKLMGYDIKCQDYCIVYEIAKEKFEEIIFHSSYNYQYYCIRRDRDNYNPNDFGTINCDLCGEKEKHTIFECPQIHFVPIKQHTINKHLAKT